MIIPWQAITKDTLDNLIEAFVLREGTDYGEQECSLSEKVLHVRQQIESGAAIIVYSELHQSIDIKEKTQLS